MKSAPRRRVQRLCDDSWLRPYFEVIERRRRAAGEMEQRLAALEAIVAGQRQPESLFNADPDRLLTNHEDTEDGVLEGATA